jgi:PAS domain S-box-containing protein
MASAGQQTGSLNIQLLVDSIPALIHTARPDGYLDYFNKPWLDYLGATLDDVTGWNWTAFVHPEDVEGIQAKWRACLATGEIFEYETRVRRANGEYRWMFHRKVPLRDPTGNIVKWYGSSLDIEERKTADEQLRRNAEELQRSEFYLAEGQRLAHMGSWAFDPGGFDYWSPELFRMHGLGQASKPPGVQEYLDRVHPQDRESMANLIKGVLAKASPFDATKRIVRPNGEVRYIRCVGVPLVENQSLKKYVGSAIDVTDHELMAEELRRREAYLAEAQRLSHTGSWAWSPDTDTRHWSEECYRVLGFDPRDGAPRMEELIQRIHPDDQPAFRESAKKAKYSKLDEEVDYRVVHPDGAVRDIHSIGHPVFSPSGDLIEYTGTVIDVTERKRAEEELRRSEMEFRQILELVPQHIAVFGPNRERLYANRVALDYLGFSLEEWQQSAGRDKYIHPDDTGRLDGVFGHAIARGSVDELELRIRKRDGSYRWFLTRFIPLHDEEGKITRWYVTGTDIEDRKRAEERLQQENVALREEIDKASMFEEIVGTSKPLKAVLSRIAKVAPTDSTVLIVGETGTGKELIARAVHKRSQRSGRAIVSVNCAAIPRDLIASELFGHEKGAFTGAIQKRLGRFELANGGTIFLDEVGELLPDTQVALLRVLQEREFERVGGGRPIHVDVRVIAATNRDLRATVASGTFRQDLFYRLNVFPVDVPPLRERKDDILMLVEYFVQRYATKSGKNIRSIDKKTLDLLQSYDWPGNIRELQNVIERSVILSPGEVFSVDELWLSKETSRPASQVHALAAFKGESEQRSEREIIEAALAECRGRVSGPSGAAAKLGIPPSTLDHRIKALRIDIKQFKFR